VTKCSKQYEGTNRYPEPGENLVCEMCKRRGQVVGFSKHGNEIRVPQNAGNISTSSATIRFQGRTLLHAVS